MMLAAKCLKNAILSATSVRSALLVSSARSLAANANDQTLIPWRDITKDRTQQISHETSKKYLKSDAYKQTYGDQPVWVPYRRNHKGLYPPKKTRKTCIRAGQISTGSPCPICRDEYLVLHEENTDLLKQFICKNTGSILSYNKTGLCQKKHFQLLVAIDRARDRGLVTFDVPFRKYDYSEYYNKLDDSESN